MQIEISSSTLTLSPGGLLAVQDAAGSRVLCRSGILWVTQEGEVKDSIVRAGEVLTIRKPGRTIVTALEDSSLTLIGADIPAASIQRQRVRAPRMVADPAPCF